jgi:hypothetical protein
MKALPYFIPLMFFLPGLKAFTQKPLLEGQLSGWLTAHPGDVLQAEFGSRYLPAFSWKTGISQGYSFDSEVSANIRATGFYQEGDQINASARIKPYRAWLRFSGNQFEVRAGLQKINFGPARMLRPLMWFDRIDPRDPLQITNGVYGILSRYYFINNANIWLWGLWGNHQRKGWESFPTQRDAPEFGGRFQHPFLGGEVAASYHHRKGSQAETGVPQENSPRTFAENRLAVDGRFDLGIGLWFETVLIHQARSSTSEDYRRLWNTGADYTMDWGKGLHITGEWFGYQTSGGVFGKASATNLLAALSASYPINIISSLQSIFYYDIKNKQWYRFLNWSWVYDAWSFYLMGFWNPRDIQIYNTMSETGIYGGLGLQFMAVFNH